MPEPTPLLIPSDLGQDDYAKDTAILDGSIPQMKVNTGAREMARQFTNPLKGSSGASNGR